MAETGFNLLAQTAGFFMILLGIIWFIFCAYEATRRKSFKKLTGIDDWDFDLTVFLRILTFSGFVVGVLSIISGAAGLIFDEPPSLAYSTQTADSVNIFTAVLLIILGLFTFLKPVNDLPISSIIAFLAALAVTAGIAWVLVLLNVEISTTIAIVLIVLFLIIFAVVAITIKFYTAGLMLLSKIISWPPFAFGIGAFCFIQGFLLLVMGISIV